MQPILSMPCEKNAVYLLSSFNGTPTPTALSVFHKVNTEALAKDLCDVLTSDFDAVNGWPKFHYVAAATLSSADQEHFHAEFARFEFFRDVICSGDCPYIGSAPLPEEMKVRVQYAVRAQVLEKNVRAKVLQNEALNLLLVVAQAYYKMLELAIGCPDPVLDLELNTAYRCVIKSLKKILRDYECLQDFPAPFTPVVPNLCPVTLRDLKWKDVAVNAEIFLGTVHEYVTTNGIRSPEPDSAAGRTLALAGKDIDTAIERAAAYRRRMFDRAQKKAAPAPPQQADVKEAQAAAQIADARQQRFRPLSDDFGAVEMDGGMIDLRGREKVKAFLRLLWDSGADCRSKAIRVGKQFPKPSSLFRPGGKFVRQRNGAGDTDVFVSSKQGKNIFLVYKNAVGIVPSAKKGSGATKYYLKVFKDSATT
jgi:hypothetical protein